VNERVYPSAAEVRRRKADRSRNLVRGSVLLAVGALSALCALMFTAAGGMCVGSYDQWLTAANDAREFSMWPLEARCLTAVEDEPSRASEAWSYTAWFYGGVLAVFAAIVVFVRTAIRSSRWRL
jgi:TRAP-type C4-dicarboxylate transport system permease small subunit